MNMSVCTYYSLTYQRQYGRFKQDIWFKNVNSASKGSSMSKLITSVTKQGDKDKSMSVKYLCTGSPGGPGGPGLP